MIIFLLCLALSSLFGFFAYESSEVVESNNITLNTIDLVFFLLSFICCAIFTLSLLYIVGWLLFGISAGNPIATAKRKWYWWRSRKAGYALHLSDAENLIEDMEKYTLIDCRNDKERLEIPLKNSMPLSEFCQPANSKENNEKDCLKDVAQLDSRFSFEGPVFVCSYTGEDSYNAIVKLKNFGLEKVFDIGGIAKNVSEYQRLAYRINFLYGAE